MSLSNNDDSLQWTSLCNRNYKRNQKHVTCIELRLQSRPINTQFDTNHFVYYRTKNDMICIEFRPFIGIIDALFNTEVVPYNDNSPKGGPFAMTSHSNALDFPLQRLPTPTTSHCSDYSTEFRRRRRGEPKRSPPELVNVGTVILNIEQHRNGNAPVESCWRTGILRSAVKGSHDTDRNIPVRQRPSSGFTPVQGQLCSERGCPFDVAVVELLVFLLCLLELYPQVPMYIPELGGE